MIIRTRKIQFAALPSQQLFFECAARVKGFSGPVGSGKTYTYSVAAVDVRGNESRRSEATSESVP